jgi:hypothetical protein
MTCHKLLLVLASVATLGVAGYSAVGGDGNGLTDLQGTPLIGFMGLGSDSHAVSDAQAAQLVGGQQCAYWSTIPCTGTGCSGTCLGQGSGSYYGLGVNVRPCGTNSCVSLTYGLTGCTG